MSDSKPLIEIEDSKMKSFIKDIKPKKMKFFKRIKRNITKFFDKRNEYQELTDEDSEIFEYKDYDLNTNIYLPWRYMSF